MSIRADYANAITYYPWPDCFTSLDGPQRRPVSYGDETEGECDQRNSHDHVGRMDGSCGFRCKPKGPAQNSCVYPSVIDREDCIHQFKSNHAVTHLCSHQQLTSKNITTATLFFSLGILQRNFSSDDTPPSRLLLKHDFLRNSSDRKASIS